MRLCENVISKERLLFSLDHLFCPKPTYKKFPILNQNHGLTPLQKCEFGNYVKMAFY